MNTASLPVDFAAGASYFEPFPLLSSDMSSHNVPRDQDSLPFPPSTMSPTHLGLHSPHPQQQQQQPQSQQQPHGQHHPHHHHLQSLGHGLNQGMHHHLQPADPYASFVPSHHMPPPMSPPSARKRRVSDLTDPQGLSGPPSAGPMSSMSAGSFMDPGGFPGPMADPNQTLSPPVVKKTRTNTPWTPAEEQKLKIMRDAGNSWSEIAKSFPSRTEGSVKKHWYKDMHYAEFAEDEVRSGATDSANGSSVLTWRQSAALLAAIKEYEASKWKVIGQKLGKPAKACEQYAKEHFGGKI